MTPFQEYSQLKEDKAPKSDWDSLSGTTSLEGGWRGDADILAPSPQVKGLLHTIQRLLGLCNFPFQVSNVGVLLVFATQIHETIYQ